MCGIVGAIADKNITDTLVEGLKRLEYRGYDSAGVATLSDKGEIDRRRVEGKLSGLETLLKQAPLAGKIGIGHTRWATHGAPVVRNAHPIATDLVAVVHNGIIENYADLKASLEAKGVKFESDTDTEVIAQLITEKLRGGKNPQDAFDETVNQLRGSYAIAALIKGHDTPLLYGTRAGAPLAIGVGEGAMYLASDSYALAPFTNKVCFLEDGDRVVLTREGAHVYDTKGIEQRRPWRTTAQSGAVSGKGNHAHYMHKEIHEQPSVVADTLNAFINPTTGDIWMPDAIDALKNASRLTLLACGTASYACSVAKYWFEQFAGLPVDLDIGSEFRYRNPMLSDGGVVCAVSQSGETLDTLEALRYAKSKGQKAMCIVNTIESTIERESDIVLRMLAGPEIGVASTKAFMTMLVTLATLAVGTGLARGTLTPERAKELTAQLRSLPTLLSAAIACEPQIAAISSDIAESRDVLYLGRGSLYPLAMEGALKLKEISYIHAEGYAAGEMKHGPIALITRDVPCVFLAPSNLLYDKTASNIQETNARHGPILLIGDKESCNHLSSAPRWTVELPQTPELLLPMVYAVPVQLLAYHAAVTKGTDVDQPRNLAKSVTVE